MDTLNGDQNNHLEKLIYRALKQQQCSAPPEYCGHAENMDTLETKLWEYAEGLMGEQEEQDFWTRTRNCPYCLQKLLEIQTALTEAETQEVPSPEEIWRIVQQRKHPVFTIAAKLLENSLQVIRSVYQEIRKETLEKVESLIEPQYAEPVPVLAEQETPPGIVFLEHRIGSENIEIELEKVTGACCDLTVGIKKIGQEAYRDFSVSLYNAAQELMASRVSREGHITFQALEPGTYALRIEEADAILAEINLTLEE